MSDPYWYSFPDRPGLLATSTGRATWCIARRPTKTTPPCMPRWGKVGKQKIVDEGPLPPFPDMSNVPNMHDISSQGEVRHDHFRRSAGQGVVRLHGQGQEGRQAVLRLAQHHAHARLDVPVARSTGDAEQQDQLRPGRSRHGAAGRQRRRAAEAHRRHRRGRQHDRRLHHRQRRRSVHLARRRHDAVQGDQGHGLWKAASACRASSAGRARSSRARSRTASSPASTGSRRLSPPPAIPTSPTSCSRA